MAEGARKLEKICSLRKLAGSWEKSKHIFETKLNYRKQNGKVLIKNKLLKPFLFFVLILSDFPGKIIMFCPAA